MCGINGFITNTNLTEVKVREQINAMNNLIVHRGPDDDGVFVECTANNSIALGMRRLSIIDLHSGSQPMFSKDNQIVIVFNGEIYNYKKLKSELEKKGVKFSTTSDTEVLLKLYETFGPSSFKQLDGMFGFSIYDKNINKLFIARDFFGEKPLYFFKDNEQLVWASELKSLVKHINRKPSISKKGLNLFLRLTYIPAPYSIYEGIHKLESNHYIEYNISSHSININEISNQEELTTNNNISFSEAKKTVKELVYESVESRSISDVPLGTFLSGGVDSSIVSLCLAQAKSTPIETFSIGFKKKSFDETDKSQTVAKLIGSNHHEFIIDESDLEQDIERILLNFDEPFADSSSLPTFLVSNKTKDSVTVALTGDGGDEVFGGYNKYYMGKMNANYTRIIPRKLNTIIKKATYPFLKVSNDNRGKRFKIKKLLDAIDYEGQFYWDIISLGFTKDNLSKYLTPKYSEIDIFNFYKEKTNIHSPKSLTDFRIIDKHISLEGDMLVKVDRTSMLNSLECRAPFLNKKIWDYTNTLPESFLMKGWDKKHILKESFKDQFPDGFLDKSKSGFGVPVGDWLKQSLKDELSSFIEDKKLQEQNIFNATEIKSLVNKHINGLEDNTFKVWTFYCFQKWYYNTYNDL